MKPLKIILWFYSKLPKIVCRPLSDIIEVKRLFYRYYHYFPNLITPKIFDEKIQWYKLYHRKPVMNEMADKYLVRNFINKMGLGHILNELYGVYDHPDEIDFNSLPDKFVLKATHGSAMNIICKDKNKLDWKLSKRIMERWLKISYYYRGRQWVYKDLKPKLICEKYLENEEYHELIDYKFYCYEGKPEVVFVCVDRYSETGVKYDAYDMEWNYIPVFKGKPGTMMNFDRPKVLGEMIKICEKLSQNFPFVRVDLYLIKNKILFGELTFYPDNGLIAFTPEHYNNFFGDLFQIPKRSDFS